LIGVENRMGKVEEGGTSRVMERRSDLDATKGRKERTKVSICSVRRERKSHNK